MVFLGREISEQRDYGDKVANEIDEEVNRIIQEAHAKATEILTKNKETLVRLAQTLIVEETLEAERLEAVFRGPEPLAIVPPPSQPAAGDAGVSQKTPPEPKKAAPVISPFPKQAPAG
jgi:cell division protease FtsH